MLIDFPLQISEYYASALFQKGRDLLKYFSAKVTFCWFAFTRAVIVVIFLSFGTVPFWQFFAIFSEVLMQFLELCAMSSIKSLMN